MSVATVIALSILCVLIFIYMYREAAKLDVVRNPDKSEKLLDQDRFDERQPILAKVDEKIGEGKVVDLA